MRRSPATALALLIGVALLAAYAFNVLIGKRFASGEAYQPGSSLRSDPLGTKALHDSLNRLPGITAERNFRQLKKLKGNADSAILCIMVDPDMFSSGSALNGEALLRFAKEGGRVVITLKGQITDWEQVMDAAEKRRKENARKKKEELENQREEKKTRSTPAKKGDPAVETKDKEEAKPDKTSKTEVKKEEKKDVAKKTSAKEDNDEDEEKKEDEFEDEMGFKIPKSLRSVLGIRVTQENFVMTPKGGLKLKTPPGLSVEEGSLPEWHTRTSLEFTETGATTVEVPESGADGEDASVTAASGWQALAKYGDAIMLAEREYGAGSVVVSTDSYFMSNEALYREPAPKFLAWLMGPAKKVYFNETHLGTTENPGIMTLARRHRLHGLFLGGMLLFALFVWRSSMSLVPARDDDGPSRVVAGRGATAGLVSLLRRGISRPQVLRKALEAWEHSTTRRNPAMQARVEQARALLPAEGVHRARTGAIRDIYRQMCQALNIKPRAGATAPAPTIPSSLPIEPRQSSS